MLVFRFRGRVPPALLLAVVPVLLVSQDASAQAPEGEKLFKRVCAVCHTAEPGVNKVGPTLAGVVGRKAGTVEGYNYSPAIKDSGIEWTPENLSKFIENPKEFLPGNKMVYAGLKDEAKRTALIDYLKTTGQ